MQGLCTGQEKDQILIRLNRLKHLHHLHKNPVQVTLSPYFFGFKELAVFLVLRDSYLTPWYFFELTYRTSMRERHNEVQQFWIKWSINHLRIKRRAGKDYLPTGHLQYRNYFLENGKRHSLKELSFTSLWNSRPFSSSNLSNLATTNLSFSAWPLL